MCHANIFREIRCRGESGSGPEEGDAAGKVIGEFESLPAVLMPAGGRQACLPC